MKVDYSAIGKRIAQRRKELGLKQTTAAERAGINEKYLSCIERSMSVPSIQVITRIALALDTTPDTLLTGSIRHESDEWRDVAEMLRNLSPQKLELAKSFILWLTDHNL